MHQAPIDVQELEQLLGKELTDKERTTRALIECPICQDLAEWTASSGLIDCLSNPNCTPELIAEKLRGQPAGGEEAEEETAETPGAFLPNLEQRVAEATHREVANLLGRRAAPAIVAEMDRQAFAAASAEGAEGDAELLGRFTVHVADDLREQAAMADIVESVVGPPGTLSMINGYRGSMKSLTTLGLAGAIATGMDTVYGLKVTAHVPVLYAYLEGASGLPRRLRAWEEYHGRPMTGVHFIHDALNMRLPEDVRAMALLAKSVGAGVIVLDSVAKTGGGKEDAEDFGAYRAGLEALRDATGAAVLMLHNSGHDKTRARGHSTLVDGVDSAVTLIPRALTEGGGVSVKDEKSRDSKALDNFVVRFEGAGPLDVATQAPWSGVVVPQSFDDSVHQALIETQAITRKVLQAIDAAGGEISPKELSAVMDIRLDGGELAKVMRAVMAGGEVEENGKQARAKRYQRPALQSDKQP